MAEGTKLIQVEGSKIGMVGLDEILGEIREQGIRGDELIKKELIRRVREKNYIPPSAEKDYAVALLNEYRKFQGMPVEGKKDLEIKILGPGCFQCDQLEREVMSVLAELGLPADLEHVRDITRLKDYKVFGTPALIINGQVRSVGKVPRKNEIRQWIQGTG